MKRLILILFLILFLLSNPSVIFADNEIRDLSEADMIKVLAYVSDGILKIDIIYHNRDLDKLVLWREGSVECNCVVYLKEGGPFRGKIGDEITDGSNTLTNFGHDLYIDIPSSYIGQRLWGIVECEVDTGYRILQASDDFLIR